MESPNRTDRTDPPLGISDRRIAPTGVIPRRLQTWMMAGLALVIVTVIVLTGHPQPPPPSDTVGRTTEPALVPPDRVRTYQRELAERDAREQLAVSPRATPPAAMVGEFAPPATTRPADPLVEDRRRREYQSLFADNVAFSQRSTESGRMSAVAGSPAPPFPLPSPQELAAFQQAMSHAQLGSTPIRPPAPGAPATERRDAAPAAAADTASTPNAATRASDPPHSGYRVLEGTWIETVLLNRLDGTFSGPVTCLVSTPVYSADRQVVVIPAGARVLGTAAPVQAWGDTRLAVSFHRLVLPDGDTVDLDQFTGLNQVGETGLKDSVDRHYLQVFGASVAIGAVSGLAQWGTRGGFEAGFSDSARQSAGASLAASTGRVLDRYLNVLPTITIHEGHRIKVYLTNDLYLRGFAPVRPGEPLGGVS